jgi:hypothetical protein
MEMGGVAKYATIYFFQVASDRLCVLVVRVPAYRSRGPGWNPGSNTYSEK